jgi:E3 SUMO-protein ligase PIAS1
LTTNKLVFSSNLRILSFLFFQFRKYQPIATMSLDPVMPPYNSSDPSATFLSSSCLDFLLIELVPLAYRITNERDLTQTLSEPATSQTAEAASTSQRALSSESGAPQAPNSGNRKLDEEEELDAVHFRLESLGYRVGQGLVERFVIIC